MKLHLLLYSFLFLTAAVNAQETPAAPEQNTDTVPTVNINEVVISASKHEDTRMRVSQQVAAISAAEIRLQNPQTAADALQTSGAVFVQKSQAGGGSPVIRGFEASRVLMVVDGVRWNNLIYRAGHLQDIIKTDPFIFERMEVLYGPSSTMYGSDALGGVVHIYTRQPRLSLDDKTSVNANAAFRYATANEEKTAHVDANIGTRRFGSLTSITFSDFGDVKMGTQAGVLDSVWGLRPVYVDRVNGKDSLVANSDPYKQVFSGYTQYNLSQKFLFRPNARRSHALNLQYSNSSNIPRYDRLTDPNAANTLRFAEWYYGPQEHLIAAYTFRYLNDSLFFSDVSAGVNYQMVEESRQSRRFNKEDNVRYLNSQVENVDVVGFDVDLVHRDDRQTMRVGFESQLNWLQSTASGIDITGSEDQPAATRYPGGDNTMHRWAIYLSNSWSLGENFVLNSGVRFEWIELNAEFTDTTFFPFPFSNVHQTNVPISGNLGLNFLPNPRLKIGGMISTGFRAPNIDDLAKVFDSEPGVLLVVPNPNLGPERTTNFELNVTKFFGDKVRWENAAFYTLFRDAIVVDKFTFNGESTIEYAGDTVLVYAAQNKQQAYITGFNTNFQADLTRFLAVSGSFTYTYGRVQTDSNDAPLDHIPPTFGRFGVRFHNKALTAETYFLFNGWKRIEDYSDSGEDNPQYATPEGMPAWYTVNLKASYRINKFIGLQAGVENILDQNYRAFASGIHAPGRNVTGTLRLSI
ncbi:MAG TPA: TonB-dependent receptor [Chitinophagales bacterium]|nr:TonB-dependent receptor [Chitinophagales bacterium]